MQIEQRFELPLPPEQAWPAFRNIELLVDCLPGASLTGAPVDDVVPLRFDVKLGPIAAGFVGTGKASFDDATRSGRFEGAATDRKTNSRVKGVVDFAMTANGAGSAVSLNVDYALSGSLAQFSRGGIVRELANALTAQFASHLSSRLVADAQTPEAATASADASSPAPVQASPASGAGMSPTAAAKKPETPANRSVAAGSGTAPRAAAQPLSASSLMWAVLRARLRAIGHRLGLRKAP